MYLFLFERERGGRDVCMWVQVPTGAGGGRSSGAGVTVSCAIVELRSKHQSSERAGWVLNPELSLQLLLLISRLSFTTLPRLTWDSL